MIFYIRESAGVDAETGAPQWNAYYYYANANGMMDGSESFIRSLFEYESQNPENVAGIVETKRYTDAATKYIGKSTIPKVRGAFTLSTKYKAFSLSTQFLYSLVDILMMAPMLN
jgi:hypothetical protein